MKLEYDTKHEVFAYGHPLMLGLAYPYDWGFFPRTKAQDGDPLDALVLHESATYPGVVMACRLIGVVRLTENKLASLASGMTALFVSQTRPPTSATPGTSRAPSKRSSSASFRPLRRWPRSPFASTGGRGPEALRMLKRTKKVS